MEQRAKNIEFMGLSVLALCGLNSLLLSTCVMLYALCSLLHHVFSLMWQTPTKELVLSLTQSTNLLPLWLLYTKPEVHSLKHKSHYLFSITVIYFFFSLIPFMLVSFKFQEPSSDHLDVLKKQFGHSEFKPMQWKIIHSILEVNNLNLCYKCLSRIKFFA